jgi:hypothetical protein
MTNHDENTYQLRILGRNPSDMPLARLAEYLSEFAAMLGRENNPIFHGIRQASTGLVARVPEPRNAPTRLRLVEARKDPADSPAGKHLLKIEALMAADGISTATVIAAANAEMFNLSATPQPEPLLRIKQEGEVDGRVVQIGGIHDASHVRLLPPRGAPFRLVVKDETLATQLARQFKGAPVRLRVSGWWVRTEAGWWPEDTCVVIGCEVLDEAPAAEVFAQLAAVPNNGWATHEDPLKAWAELRGFLH